ncbi:MAG TPA: hypothetical protein VGM66_14690 [Candidatus Udaeobacter sp.]|jgi:hypothetical protein
MNGFIYIASAFHTVNRSKCGRSGAWIDNDGAAPPKPGVAAKPGEPPKPQG